MSGHRLATKSGNMTILMGGMIAMAVGISASVMDYMSVSSQKQTLQGVADRAAIAAAQELIVFQGTESRVSSVAQSFVRANYRGEQMTSAVIADGGRTVEVSVEAKANTYFPGPVSDAIKNISAHSTAEVSGGGYVCLIGLDTDAVATLNMMNKARLSATTCAVYSNSVSPKSLWLHDTARIAADLTCVAGGIQGPLESFSFNQPTEDCPPIEDPLRDRPKPDVGDTSKCDHKNVHIAASDKVTLKPGVYCGGISITGGEATLQPGIYVMSKRPVVGRRRRQPRRRECRLLLHRRRLHHPVPA